MAMLETSAVSGATLTAVVALDDVKPESPE